MSDLSKQGPFDLAPRRAATTRVARRGRALAGGAVGAVLAAVVLLVGQAGFGLLAVALALGTVSLAVTLMVVFRVRRYRWQLEHKIRALVERAPDRMPPTIGPVDRHLLGSSAASEWAAVEALHAVERGDLEAAYALLQSQVSLDPDVIDSDRLDHLVGHLLAGLSPGLRPGGSLPLPSKTGALQSEWASAALQRDLLGLLRLIRDHGIPQEEVVRRYHSVAESRTFDRFPVLGTAVLAAVAEAYPDASALQQASGELMSRLSPEARRFVGRVRPALQPSVQGQDRFRLPGRPGSSNQRNP